MITFPPYPKDGEIVVDKVDDYVVIVWTYSEDKNEWTSARYGPVESYVFTDQVFVRDNVQELPEAAAADPSELLTQKDVNHYLNEQQPEMPEIPSMDGYATEQWVQDQSYATQQQLSQLQQEVDNLSGLVVQARYRNGSGITTRPGDFVVLANDTQQTRFSTGEAIRLHETDASNKAPALVRIIIGDLIHIVNPQNGTSTVLQVTHAAGIVHSYICLGGTMDVIPNNTALEFRISGAN